MRKTLISTFDTMYILDLHRSSKKKETAPDGTIDQNVFDIMQGVSINLFVKSRLGSDSKKFKVFDLYGKREDKYNFLSKNSIKNIDWIDIQPKASEFYLINRDLTLEPEYRKGFSMGEVFRGL